MKLKMTALRIEIGACDWLSARLAGRLTGSHWMMGNPARCCCRCRHHKCRLVSQSHLHSTHMHLLPSHTDRQTDRQTNRHIDRDNNTRCGRTFGVANMTYESRNKTLWLMIEMGKRIGACWCVCVCACECLCVRVCVCVLVCCTRPQIVDAATTIAKMEFTSHRYTAHTHTHTSPHNKLYNDSKFMIP